MLNMKKKAQAYPFAIEYILTDKKIGYQEDRYEEKPGLDVPTENVQSLADIFETSLPADWTEAGMGEYNGGNFYTTYKEAKIAFDQFVKTLPLESIGVSYTISLSDNTDPNAPKVLETFSDKDERLPNLDDKFNLPGNMPEGLASKLNMKKKAKYVYPTELMSIMTQGLERLSMNSTVDGVEGVVNFQSEEETEPQQYHIRITAMSEVERREEAEGGEPGYDWGPEGPPPGISNASKLNMKKKA